MIHLAHHDKDGHLIQLISVPEAWRDIQIAPEGTAFLELEEAPDDPATFLKHHHVLDGKISPRPKMTLQHSPDSIKADGEDFLSLSGFPLYSFIDILRDGEAMFGATVEEEAIKITTSEPGRYLVRVRSLPFIDEEFWFDAR
jgi:hypothetical protein